MTLLKMSATRFKLGLEKTLYDTQEGLRAVGSDLGAWGVIRKPKRAQWSVIDSFIDTDPAAKRQRTDMRRRPVARRMMRTRMRRPVTRRRLRFKRKRTSFKKRVQAVTLSLAESKKHQTRATLAAIQDALPAVYPLTAVPEASALTTLTNHKNQRIGTEIKATGCRIELHFQNALASTAIWIRVIAGYKKYNRLAANKDDIFVNPLTDVNEELTTSLAYPDIINATVDKRQFRKVKDFRFRLGGSTESTSMENFKSVKWWWPMKGRSIKFEGFSEGSESQTWDPFFMVYVTNETGATIAGTLCNFSYRTIFYFKDP